MDKEENVVAVIEIVVTHPPEENVLKYYESAGKVGKGYHPVNNIGASPAAFLKTIKKISGDTLQGWISCGSASMMPEVLKCNDTLSIVMLYPEPKKFSSLIQVYTKEGRNDTVTIEVNKPLKIMQWKVYQTGYDERLGKWSNISIVEIFGQQGFIRKTELMVESLLHQCHRKTASVHRLIPLIRPSVS